MRNVRKGYREKISCRRQTRGGKAYKFVSPGNVGVPDRIVIWPNGVIHFVELKTSKGVLSRLQGVQARELQKLNQKVFVLKGDDAVSGYLDQFTEEFGVKA